MLLAHSTEKAHLYCDDLRRRECLIGVCIGNFDGFHLGHRAVFNLLKKELAQRALLLKKKPFSVMFTFEPHPRRVLGKRLQQVMVEQKGFERLVSYREKLRLAKEEDFSLVFSPKFSSAFAELLPADFVKHYLLETLGAQLVTVGNDWKFGRGRKGDVELLAQLGKSFGFEVLRVPDLLVAGERVSSSAVREAVKNGDIAHAESLLGRAFCLIERVRKGEQRGRLLGYRTANLEFCHQVLPKDGIYATQAQLRGRNYLAVTYVGQRPTFSGQKRLVEVHLLGGQVPEFYGEHLRVEFLAFLRPERRFRSQYELQDAIAEDVIRAEAVLLKRGCK